MALSTPISLTSVRDHFGLSGSINLTNLHRGENNVINVQSTYGSDTTGKGSVVTSGSNYSNIGNLGTLTVTNPHVNTVSGNYSYGQQIPAYLVNTTVGGTAYGSHLPFTLYQYGGTPPSLGSANTGIADSGSIDLTDYVGAYRKVTPTAGSITGSYSGTQRFWFSGAPYAYAGWYGGNYEKITGYLGTSDVSNYTQLISVSSNPYSSSSSGSVTCSFTLSHAGVYTLIASVTGNGGTTGSHYINVSGTGVSLKTHSDTATGATVSGNIPLIAGLPTAMHRLFELTHTDTSATITLTCGGTGGNTFAQIRTNTNYLRSVNTSDTTQYTDMMTQS